MIDAPERIWMTSEDHGASWSGAFRAFRCSSLDHSGDDGPTPDYPEYIRADIHAARIADLERQVCNADQLATERLRTIIDLTRQLAEAREVKPLEWSDYPGESVAEPYQIEARGAFWRVYILTGYECADPILTPAGDLDHPTLEAAKAAAQQDYQARILSALKDPTP